MLCSATPPTSPLPWLSLLPLSPSLELGPVNPSIPLGAARGGVMPMKLLSPWVSCGKFWSFSFVPFPAGCILPWGSEHLHHPAPLLQQLGEIGVGQGLDSGGWEWPGHPPWVP